jgi:hypothetical protein
MGFTFADFDVTAIAGIAVGFGLVVIVPVVAILAEHQRKMARIMYGQAGPEEISEKSSVVIGLHANVAGKKQGTDDAILDELRAMRGELADLRMQVASLQGQPGQNETVRERLNQGS